MRKRVLGILLSAVLTLSAMGIAIPMTAAADSMMVVTVGADLTEAEKAMILKYFNVAGQSYTTITVTNDDEWSHLGGYMSRDIVGYRTISCALIRPMTSGGIQVKTANLTYVTSNMIASNLATAGVTNCEVLAAAPFQVSGTGALTGALMAYENLSGVTLADSKKQAAAQEFATTYELGKTVGQQEAQQIVNDIKMQVINGTLEEDNSITNEEITEIVNNVVNNYTTNNVTNNDITNNNTTTNSTTNITNNNGLSEADVAALQALAVQIARESYEQGTLDALSQIQKTLEGQTQTTSTAATTQIEQNAAPTAEPAAAQADLTQPDGTVLSAADVALSQDSLLTNTDESALAATTADGSVISSSTAESTIDTSVATNLDTQIEEQIAAQAETAAQPEAPAAEPEVSTVSDTGIPEPTDVTVLGGTDTGEEIPAPEEALNPAAEIPADTSDITVETPTDVTDTTIEAPADVTDTTFEAPADVTDTTFEAPADDTDTTIETPADYTDPSIEEPADDTDISDENPEPEAGEETPSQNMVTLTADDVANGTVSFRTCSTAEYGSQPASGVSAVEVVVPYENLTPVSGALHVTAGSGAEAAYLNIDPSESDLVLLTSADSYDVPSGSTKILMVPKDGNDISLQTDFAPSAGETYTYTLNAQFAMDDNSVLDIQINNYDPYYGNPVSDKGFSVSGSCLNKSSDEGASGSVLFPGDGSAVFATVTADDANISVTGTDGSMKGGVSAGAGDVVNIEPYQDGPVTLDITYYAAAPEDGVTVDPGAELGSAQYTIYFN